MLVAQANAKINLGLEILRRRPDGFHDIVTILQQIDLGDRLTFRRSSSITLQVDSPSLETDTNLVLRAAHALRSRRNYDGGARITLEKRIPIAAGLGGGSSDAAVTLLALNRLWDLDESTEALAEIARAVGSDVAFFLNGGTQLATERGDIYDRLPTPVLWAVLATGTDIVSDKTRRLYQAIRPEDFSDGRRTRSVAEDIWRGRAISSEKLGSGFERATLELFPSALKAFRAIKESGGIPLLCGAGPTAMTVHESRSDAERTAAAIDARGIHTKIVQTAPKSGWLVEENDT